MIEAVKKPGWRKLSAWFLIQALVSYLAITKMADPLITDIPPGLAKLMVWNVTALIIGNVFEHGLNAAKDIIGRVKITAAD
jgi:hypothetical protein